MSRSSVHVARGDAMVTWATNVACSPPLCETLAKVHYHDLVRENATELERMQLGYLFVGLACQIHMGFEQWKDGVITRNELEEVSGPASALLSQPYLASAWPILKLGYPADFRDWYEQQHGLVDG